jgi:DNA-binding response OmpR family regulator
MRLPWERRSRYVVSDAMLHPSFRTQAANSEGVIAQPQILVVEDDFLIRMMLVEVLADDGFDVLEAETGDQAAALLNADIALVVTDIQLPGSLNGHQLVALARQSRPRLPAVYTSGRLAKATPSGDLDMSISKPYQGAEVCAAVRQLLAV